MGVLCKLTNAIDTPGGHILTGLFVVVLGLLGHYIPMGEDTAKELTIFGLGVMTTAMRGMGKKED